MRLIFLVLALAAFPVPARTTPTDLNFKDGLAIAGRPGVARTSPLIPGIDIVGTVESSDDPRWRSGDRVRWNDRDGVFQRDLGDGENAEIKLGDRIYRVRLTELA